MKENNYTVGNVDISILVQEPKMADYISAMKENLANDLNSKASLINIKATTTEGMGFIGRGEGIAAHAVALLFSA
jgi:2-C-methyl-D-erythritol 2,4-cyclodiphosphate synthase